MKPAATILVSGMIAADPWQGGATWAVLQYVLGLGRLGHEVYFIEPIHAKSLRPETGSLASSNNAKYFLSVVDDFELRDRAALLLDGTRETVGLSYEQLVRIAKGADLIINIAGMLTDEALFGPVRTRVYLDLDPAFDQLWHAVQGIDMRFAGHTHFVTIGLAIGRPTCPVPTCGLNWIPTLQPVVLERWSKTERMTHGGLTTIGNWRAYGSIEFGGVLYGQKAHSLRPLFSLPTETEERFLLALSIHPAETNDLTALAHNRWKLIDPAEVAHTPRDYQRFIQGSKAEFGIAKSGYVLSRCGWFSDRSACYLASGRPVIAQETGFSQHLPVGEGLFSFTSKGDVLEAIATLNHNYETHARTARQIAQDYFDSDKVLQNLLERIAF